MKKTIEDINVENKKVLVRVDFNVPMKNGNIISDKRIEEALPTIKYLLAHNASVILCSHLGRPDGIDLHYSLKPIAKRLSSLLRKKVIFATDVVGNDARQKAKDLQPGQVLLLENVRFAKEETKNDSKFAQKLARLANVYVNDAFGSAHREHASTYGVEKLLPNAVGFLMNKDISIIGDALKNPERPFVAILGGAKVGDKIGLIENLLDKVNTLIIGGAMAFTFIKALGGNVGKSLVDDDKVVTANKLIKLAQDKGVDILLPLDCICVKDLNVNNRIKKFDSFNIPDDYMGVDIGAKSLALFKKVLKKSKTVIWNGPMGVIEYAKFEKGTKNLAKIVTRVKGVTIIGGGDSCSAIIKFGLEHKFSHISTGGGASLELLEGKNLPGIQCISNKEKENK